MAIWYEESNKCEPLIFVLCVCELLSHPHPLPLIVIETMVTGLHAPQVQVKGAKKSLLYFYCLEVRVEKAMATHSSVLAWRIPGTGEPGGLPSLGSHRVTQLKCHTDMTEVT